MRICFQNLFYFIYFNIELNVKDSRTEAVLEVLSDEGRPLVSLMWLSNALKKLYSWNKHDSLIFK